MAPMSAAKAGEHFVYSPAGMAFVYAILRIRWPSVLCRSRGRKTPDSVATTTTHRRGLQPAIQSVSPGFCPCRTHLKYSRCSAGRAIPSLARGVSSAGEKPPGRRTATA